MRMRRPLQGISRVLGHGHGSREAKAEIGAVIRDLREQAGLTQRQLGDMVELAASQISDIERGERFPEPRRMAAFAQALHVNRVEWGKLLLEHSDPFTYALIYGQEKVQARIEALGGHIGLTSNQPERSRHGEAHRASRADTVRPR